MRCRLPDLFRQGEYLPLTAVGERAKHVVAFSRRWDGRTLIAVVPRLVSPLLDRSADLSGDRVWEDTFIEVPFSAEARYQDIFTGERVEIVDRAGRPGLALRDLFKGFPVVLALDEELANEQVSIEPTAPAAAPP
jgi:(1->4)-alpha-D-glucan 1-alpha-D-glucosylmutase